MLLRRILIIIALAAPIAFVGCTSSGETKPADPKSAPRDTSDDDARVHDVDPNAPPPTLGAQNAPKSPSAAADDAVTVIYVTQVKDPSRAGGVRPCAVIVTSDKDSPYLAERPRPSRVLKPLPPAEMKGLLAELDGLGFSTLPWKPDAREKIGTDRALYVIRGAARQVVMKVELRSDPEAMAFTRVEKKLIAVAHAPTISEAGGPWQSAGVEQR